MNSKITIIGLFIRVEGTSPLTKAVSQSFEKESSYIWIYEGSNFKSLLMAIGVLVIIFAGVMFPLWPTPLRQVTL